MSLLLPRGLSSRAGAIASIGASGSAGTSMVNSATHTKGAWQQLIAASARDACGIVVMIQGKIGFSSAAHLVDIGVGAASSEQIIAANLAANTNNWANSTSYYFFPIAIPAGSRIAARSQNSYSSGYEVNVSVLLLSGDLSSALGRVETCGATPASTAGTNIDPGASANTKGAWTQIIGSTSFGYRGVVVGFLAQGGNKAADLQWMFDVAVGPAASEQIVVPDVIAACDTDQRIPGTCCTPFFPVRVPAGSRIAARAACNSTAAGTRTLDLIVYGVG